MRTQLRWRLFGCFGSTVHRRRVLDYRTRLSPGVSDHNKLITRSRSDVAQPSRNIAPWRQPGHRPCSFLPSAAKRATSYLSRAISSNQTVSADNLQPDNKKRLNNFNFCWTNVCLITARDKDDSYNLGLLVFTGNFSCLDMYFSRSGSKELTTM